MRVIFLGIFAAVTAVHLASILFKKGTLQAVTKSCLMPLLLAVYISGAERFFFPVVLALFFGWAGDVLLIKIQDVRFFRLGLIGFLLGHVCYIPSLLYFAQQIKIPVLAGSLIAALFLGILLQIMIRPSKEMRLASIMYEVVILLMAASALQLFIARGFPFGALAFAGSLCFLVSDSALAFFTFRTKPAYGDFLVMSTYIAAQLCITLGLSSL